MEINYSFINQPMTDYLVTFHHPYYHVPLSIGVSVTRAFAYRRRYTKHDALRLLKKKLSGVNSSTRNIANESVWKQILHIWCPSGKIASTVRRVYSRIGEEYKKNTLVMVTVVNCDWVFTDDKGRNK
ncbi:2691_t:CDS:1, partial [Acaulospora morrowiae]